MGLLLCFSLLEIFQSNVQQDNYVATFLNWFNNTYIIMFECFAGFIEDEFDTILVIII